MSLESSLAARLIACLESIPALTRPSVGINGPFEGLEKPSDQVVASGGISAQLCLNTFLHLPLSRLLREVFLPPSPSSWVLRPEWTCEWPGDTLAWWSRGTRLIQVRLQACIVGPLGFLLGGRSLLGGSWSRSLTDASSTTKLIISDGKATPRRGKEREPSTIPRKP
ncbi:hypothetical protein EMCRGX_G021943 [Ephydatia muelleri]